MTTLADLSDDILDSILSYHGASDQLVSLYLCGNSMLNTRICRCVSVFRMEDAPECRNMFRIPRLLHSLSKLRDLEIHSTNWKDALPEVVESLKKLPPTIKRLHISCSSPLIFCNTLVLDEDFEPPIYMPLRNSNDHMFIDLKAYFPILEDLKLKLPYSRRHPTIIKPHEWSIFPSTLTALYWRTLQILKMPDISLMPPHLKSITIDFEEMSPEDFCNLPASVQSIGGTTAADAHFLSCLPRQVTSLQESSFEYSFAVASSLPPSLTSLSLFSFDEPTLDDFAEAGINPISALPRNLTHLNIGFLALSFGDLQHLPSQLTTILDLDLRSGVLEECAAILDRKTENTSSAENPSLWPTNLRHLVLIQRISSTIRFRGLPSTLTRLEIVISIPVDQLADVVLPPLLTSLSLVSQDHDWKPTNEDPQIPLFASFSAEVIKGYSQLSASSDWISALIAYRSSRILLLRPQFVVFRSSTTFWTPILRIFGN